MIAVTGATGFLGRALVEYFYENNQQVLCINRRAGSYKPFVELDLASEPLSLLLHRPDALIHCAAVIPNNENGITENLAYSLIKKIDKTVFEYCKREHIPVIYISSLGVETFHDLLFEGNEIYFNAKFEGEKLFSQIAATILRISVPVGVHMLKANIINNFINQAFSHDRIEVWGNGSRQQNFINVEDICKLILQIVSSNKFMPGIFNVCSDQNMTMAQLAYLIRQQLETVKVSFSGNEDPGVKRIPSSNNYDAKQTWNWSPNPNSDVIVQSVVREIIDARHRNKN